MLTLAGLSVCGAGEMSQQFTVRAGFPAATAEAQDHLLTLAPGGHEASGP